MQYELIHLSEVLKTIRDSQEPFDITFCTCDKSRGTGGDRETLKGVVSSRMAYKAKTLGFREPDPSKGNVKRQNHYANATRNLLLPNGRHRKVHIFLIEFFNGKQVYY